MALVTNNLVFLHIPKTAGLWFRHIFKVCKIDHFEVGDQHSHFPELLKYKDNNFYADKKKVVFVRHPLSWYQSRWAFRIKHGWKPQHPLDFNCASNDFKVFIKNILNYKPNGWFSWECKMFIDTIPGGVDFVGKSENLVDDAVTALKLAGEKFNEKLVRSIQRINDSDLDGKPSSYWGRYTPELANAILQADSEVVDKYYRNFQIDINQFC